MSDLLILGAGGHGKVVAEIALMTNKWSNVVFLDDNPEHNEVDNIPVVGKIKDCFLLKSKYQDAFVAIGNNQLRLKWINKLSNEGFRLPTIIHPFTSVSSYCRIGEGTVIMPGAVLNTGVVIGRACIINTSSSIDHDCVLEDGVHISPGVSIGGTVRVGSCTWICIGSHVANNIKIGYGSVIAAGATVIKPVPDNVMVAGVPAMIKKRFGDD
jgi:sugar O-acyltransferase (sialic acid O-acetyltransferase NeuD family)